MTTPRSRRHASRSGFTIVELLVVVGIILVLLGLLLPAVSGARRRGFKADEVNRIRQVGIAWDLYAQSNGDAALPGYLSIEVQLDWRVGGRYEFANGAAIAPSETEEWPWRLMPYLDHSQETLMGHLALEYADDRQAASNYNQRDFRAARGGYLQRPKHIAQEPGFGYNAFYVGGWWDQLVEVTFQYPDPENPGQERTETDVVPQPRFYNARSVATGKRIDVVAGSPASIVNPTQLVVFCSVAGREVGVHKEAAPEEPGSHFAAAPFYAETELWHKSGKSESIVEVLQQFPIGDALTPTPVGRYTDQAAVLHADLHTASMAPGALDDQRFWVNGADTPVFLHTEN